MSFFVDKRKTYRVMVKEPKDEVAWERYYEALDDARAEGMPEEDWPQPPRPPKERAVILRKMSEGDVQERNDIATSMRMRDRSSAGTSRNGKRRMQGFKKKKARRGEQDDDARLEYALGGMRGFDLERSIVDWELVDDFNKRVPPTPEAIRNLDAYVADQIHDHIALINPSLFPSGREVTDEEEEEDYEEPEDFGDDGASTMSYPTAEHAREAELYGPDEDAGEVAVMDEDDEEESPTRTT